MKKIIIEHWIVLLIFIIAIFLRFYQLSSVPPSLNWDEAALGYNAYSILQTGKDEYGSVLPLVFKSFGDFKPGIYVYLTVPFVAVFGLNEFSTRTASSLFGALTVLAIYFLVLELFSRKRLAIISALFLAISPWHLLLSRPAYESIVAVFFNVCAILFFLKFIKKSSILFFLLSSLSFLISIYTYQVSKLFVPLIVFGLIGFWFKEVKNLINLKIISVAIVAILLSSPLYLGTLFGGQGGRLEVFSALSYPQTQEEINNLAIEDQTKSDSTMFQLWHNQPYYLARIVLYHYLNHFSSNFLFFSQDSQNSRTAITDNGMMYLFDILFLTFGVYVFVKYYSKKPGFFTFFWLLISPISAAITRDLIAPIRAANLIIPLVIFSSFGADYLIDKLKTLAKVGILIGTILIFFMIWNFWFLADSYFVHNPELGSRDWLYGHKEAVKIIESYKNQADRIIFTTNYNEPYIFNLFYSKYPPENFQKQAKLEMIRGQFDVGEVPGFDKYVFRPIYWPNDRDLKNTLIIGAEMELPVKDIERDIALGKVEVVGDIKFLDGSKSLQIVLTKNR